MHADNAATEHPMCSVCRQIRPKRYIECKGTCKAKEAYDKCEKPQCSCSGKK